MEDYCGRGIEVILSRLRSDDSIPSASVKAVEKHISFMRARDSSPRTVYKHLFALEKFLKALGNKNAAEVTREDVEVAISKINSLGLAPETKRNIRTLIKQFYKHLLGDDEYYPKQVAWIKTSGAKKDRLLPEDLVTEDEVMKLLQAARNPRDRAIVALLFDSGIRAGELLSMRRKDVDFSSEPVHVRVSGKTGTRIIPVMFSVPYLAQYMDLTKGTGPNDRLWEGAGVYSESSKYLEQDGLSMMLKKVAKRAGIGKRIYAHLFRHSRASYYANRMTEQQLKVFFGWTGDSKMASTYVHLSGRDIDNAVLNAHGIASKDYKEIPKLSSKVCPRCREANQVSSVHCSRCGSALDIYMVMKEKEAEERVREMAAKAIPKPEITDRTIDKVVKRKKKREERAIR